MKKKLSIVLILLSLLSLFACGSKQSTSKIEDTIRQNVDSTVSLKIRMEYEATRVRVSVTNIEESIGNYDKYGDGYNVYGIAYVYDNYNDEYTARFTVRCSTEGKCYSSSLNIETPTKR